MRLVIEKNQTGLGMAEDVGVACCGVVWVKPDDNQARRMRSHVETHPIDSVGQQNRHTVSGLKFLLCECSAEPVNARGNRVPGVIAPLLGDRIVVSVSNADRTAPDTLAEQPPQRTRLTSSDYVAIGNDGPLGLLGHHRVRTTRSCSTAYAAKAARETVGSWTKTR